MLRSQPSLLVAKVLIRPFDQAIVTIEEIGEKAKLALDSSFEMQGYFVLSVAALESALSESYLYFLKNHPESADIPPFQVGIDDLLTATLPIDLIQERVERDALSQAYGRFKDQLSRFMRALRIVDPSIDQDLIDRIIEIKETRNLVLHNRLRVNRLYEVRAGRFRRRSGGLDPLPLDVAYVCASLGSLKRLILELRERMSKQYAEYTKIAAVRRLWKYIFSSPVMPFDEFWILDESEDEVAAMKHGQHETTLSSSERMFLAVWRSHFNSWKDPHSQLAMYSLKVAPIVKTIFGFG